MLVYNKVEPIRLLQENYNFQCLVTSRSNRRIECFIPNLNLTVFVQRERVGWPVYVQLDQFLPLHLLVVGTVVRSVGFAASFRVGGLDYLSSWQLPALLHCWSCFALFRRYFCWLCVVVHFWQLHSLASSYELKQFLILCGVFLCVFFVFVMTSAGVHVEDVLLFSTAMTMFLISSFSLLFCVSMWQVFWSSSNVYFLRSFVIFLPPATVGISPYLITSS